MGNKLIVGNIKMNLKFGDIYSYLKHFESIDNPNLVICPSYIYIPYFLKSNFKVGSQDVCCSSSTSCTGEVSAEQLKSIGVTYTLIGHSERRQKLRETDLDINKKVKNSLKENIKVILCIGETQEERDLLKKDLVLKKQIMKALLDVDDIKNIIIAYEPVWSIGTNQVPNNKEIIDTVNYIKQIIFNKYHKFIKVIYGGSINEKNVDKFNEIKNIDGYLIGASSINPEKFIKIINKVL